MTLLVIGASGQIGHCLLPRLDAAGHEWIALSRRPRIDDPRWREGRLPDRMPVLPPVSAVVGLGPLDHLATWLAAQRLPGTPHVIATSSMSAETKRDSEVPDERDVSRRLRDAETTLIATCASRGMPWTIFRPTLVYGLGMDKSLTPIVDSARRRHVFPLPSGRGLRQPVHADDIAQAVVAALGTARSYGHTFPIGGGDRMSAAEMFRRVRRSAGTMALPVPVPRLLLDLAVLVSRDLRGPVTRLDSDLIADNRDLESLLGVHPRPFQPEPSHWKSPR
jgi:nucleoside-diphosphate-sugar epimerase